MSTQLFSHTADVETSDSNSCTRHGFIEAWTLDFILLAQLQCQQVAVSAEARIIYRVWNENEGAIKHASDFKCTNLLHTKE